MADNIFERATTRRNAWHTGSPDPTRPLKPEARTRLYGEIRAACKRLGMDEDDRRGLIRERFDRGSMSDLSGGQLGELLDHLNRNWKGPLAHRGHLGKIKALWWSLHWLGEVDDPHDKAIDAFVKRQCGVSALRFLDHTKAPAVIEALKDWLARTGVAWPSRRQTEFLATNTPDFTAARHDRQVVLDAIVVGLARADWREVLIGALGLGAKRYSWTEHELDMAIRHLGRELRRARKGAA